MASCHIFVNLSNPGESLARKKDSHYGKAAHDQHRPHGLHIDACLASMSSRMTPLPPSAFRCVRGRVSIKKTSRKEVKINTHHSELKLLSRVICIISVLWTFHITWHNILCDIRIKLTQQRER